MFAMLLDAGSAGLTSEEWNDKAREAGIGAGRRADLYDNRRAMQPPEADPSVCRPMVCGPQKRRTMIGHVCNVRVTALLESRTVTFTRYMR